VRRMLADRCKDVHAQVLMAEPKMFSQKLSTYLSNYWNCLTAFAVFGHIAGVIVRLAGEPNHSRVIITTNAVLWYLKLLNLFSIHNRLGPYITMVGKMVSAHVPRTHM
jgi:hypothetical protein